MTPSLASSVLVHCQGILFDMDGILISSLGSVERSWTKWANLRGLDPAHVLSLIARAQGHRERCDAAARPRRRRGTEAH